ncbi:hypothetical protein D3C71_1746550 [compost metagenome]
MSMGGRAEGRGRVEALELMGYPGGIGFVKANGRKKRRPWRWMKVYGGSLIAHTIN